MAVHWNRLIAGGLMITAVGACQFLLDDAPPAGPLANDIVDASNDAVGLADVSDSGVDAPPVSIDAPIDPSAVYEALVLEDGPVAYWRFDEGRGAPILQTVGKQFTMLNGTAEGQGVPGAFGRAISFDGSPTSYLSVTAAAGLLDTPIFTIEAWIRPRTAPDASAPAGGQLLARRYRDDGGVLNGYGEYVYDDVGGGIVLLEERAIQGDAGAAQAVTAPVAIGTGTFTHVVIVRTAAELTAFTNGYVRTVRSSLAPGPLPLGDTPMSIGTRFDGDIDELAIYAHALSPLRIAAHFQARPH